MRFLIRSRTPRLLALLLCLSLAQACASVPAQRARHVSIDVHAVLATLDDAERAVCNPQPSGECQSAHPNWTTERHRTFSRHMVVALKAGQTLNRAVRATPITDEGKASLAIVAGTLRDLREVTAPFFPAGSPVAIALGAATEMVLAILPFFLE